jgi:hypothetical protein
VITSGIILNTFVKDIKLDKGYMSKADLISTLKSNLFADRGTDLEAALEYARQVALASDQPMMYFTAIQVVLNTVANIIDDQYDQRIKV